MATCRTSAYTNILDLPVIKTITTGDFLIVESAQGTTILDFKDFIIPLENTNFSDVIAGNVSNIASLSSELKTIGNSSLPSIASLRISLESNSPVPTINSNNVNTLYIHKYNGDSVALYDTTLNKWVLRELPDVAGQRWSLSRSIEGAADSIHFVFLKYENNSFSVSLIPWSNDTIGEQTFSKIEYLDGIPVYNLDRGSRLIGCIKIDTQNTSSMIINESQTTGATTKLYVWNAQNRVPVSVAGYTINSTQQAYSNNYKFFGNNTSQFKFILGDYGNVDYYGNIRGYYGVTNTSNNVVTYAALNNSENTLGPLDTPTIGSLSNTIGNTASANLNFSTSVCYKKSIPPGHHFIQLYSRASQSSNTYVAPAEGRSNGYIATIEM